MKLAASIRCSTEEQAGKNSLPTQENGIRAYCDQQGHTLTALHTDAGMSGKIHPTKRPGLAAALALIKRGEADGLIVFKLDRMSRSIRDVIDLVDMFDRKGWALVSVSESIDTKSAMGQMFVQMLAMLAQLERKLIGERTREAMAQLARDGKRRSGKAPFGYRFEGGKVVPDKAEQATLADIRGLQGLGHGPRTIARAFNETGRLNPRTGGLWARSTVASILDTARRTG